MVVSAITVKHGILGRALENGREARIAPLPVFGVSQ
jgi:hypothetical protein